MYRYRKLSIALGALAALGACGKRSSSTTAATTGAGSFPDVSAAAAKVVPQVGTSSLQMSSLSILSASPFVTYNGDSSSFSTDSSAIQDILGPSGGVVTRIINQIESLAAKVESINSSYSDANGDPTNCTSTFEKSFGSDGDLTIPFFSGVTSDVFWAGPTNLTTVPMARCYVQSSADGYDQGFVFGRTAISGASASCTDPYVYVIVNGYSSLNATNTEDTANRGTTTSGYQTQAFYYNGCTKDVGIAASLTTLYPNATGSTNNEFSGRFELWGNTDAQTFQVRALKFDAYANDSANFNAYVGAGKASGSTGNFILKKAPYTCNTSACTGTVTPGTAKTYCLALSSTAGSVSVDSTTTNCSTHEADFDELTGFSNPVAPELSRSTLDFSTGAPFGL